MCGWFKINTDRNNYSTLYDVYSSTFGYNVVQTDATGTDLLMSNEEFNTLFLGSLTVGTWYFLGLSISNSSSFARKRALGDPTFTSYSRAGQLAQANRLRIGESHFGSERLAGAVAYFKLWSAGLSAAELEAEYASATPVRTANLYSFYRFDTASTTDNSGNGRTLTATGTPGSEASPILPSAITPFTGWGIPIL